MVCLVHPGRKLYLLHAPAALHALYMRPTVLSGILSISLAGFRRHDTVSGKDMSVLEGKLSAANPKTLGVELHDPRC